MTAQDFDGQVKRLSDTFGPQHYKQERLTLLWREVRDFDRRWFERVVDSMIASFKFAPLPADFADAVSGERERRWKERKESTSLQPWAGAAACRFCKDTGIRMCTKQGASGVWAFRCDCSRGQSDPRDQIPVWGPGFEQHGYEWTDLPVYRPAAVSG